MPMNNKLCIAFTLFVLLASGCGEGNPLDSKIKSIDKNDYLFWYGKFVRTVPNRVERQFEEALQEIKFEIMAQKRASGPNDIERVLWEEINNVTARGVIIRGFASKKQRLEYELKLAEQILSANSSMTTNPGDTESYKVLTDKIESDRKRVERIKIDLQLTLDVLKEYNFDMEGSGKRV